MSILSRWVGTKFNDPKLVEVAERAIATDPLITDATAFTATSEKGVVKLMGVVHRVQEKDRIEGVVRSAVRSADLKLDRIDNQITVR
jgi:osmotically-inducible protein OsmY